jgi:hypothetical protein
VPRYCLFAMASPPRMVFLGFGKYARADRIYALEPIQGEERGNGRRTLVWVEGMPEPMVAARTQETILEEIGADVADGRTQRSRRRRPAQPQLFPDGA